MVRPLVASPGASAVIGAGALVYPAVVLVLVGLCFANAFGRQAILRLVGIGGGLLAIGTAAGDLFRDPSDDFSGYLVAWVVAGVASIGTAVWGLLHDRRRELGHEDPRD